MAGFAMRKNQRLKKLVPVRYLGDGIAGEGIIEDLSLSGSYITGNAPVSVGMALALQIFVPGDPEPLLIDPASVKWVKGSEFGIDFHTPPTEGGRAHYTGHLHAGQDTTWLIPQGIRAAGRCMAPLGSTCASATPTATPPCRSFSSNDHALASHAYKGVCAILGTS